MDALRARAISWLMMTEGAAGAFDELDGDTDDATARDVPMTAARHVALATLATLNERYNLGEIVGYDNVERAELVDELTHIAETAVGPGPFDINLALELNKQHRNAELNKEDYSIAYESRDDLFRLTHTRDGQTNHIGTTSDALFEVVRDNFINRQEKNND